MAETVRLRSGSDEQDPLQKSRRLRLGLTYVKHDDALIVAEVEFVFELTSSFMKHFIRLSKPAP